MDSSTGLFLSAAAFAAATLARRRATKAQYVCGDDCECCHRSAPRRAPAVPAVRDGPKKVTLAPGASAWLCTCGQSAKYPFCDGTHRKVNAAEGTAFAPKQVTNDGAAPVDKYVCTCGHTKNEAGMCDGSHRKVVFKA